MTAFLCWAAKNSLRGTPTGKEMQTLSTNNYISCFFLCLQHQYICARLPAHSYTSEHHLKFGGYGNMFITSWRHSRKAEECRAHGPRELLNIWQLPDLLQFSLVPNFKVISVCITLTPLTDEQSHTP